MDAGRKYETSGSETEDFICMAQQGTISRMSMSIFVSVILILKSHSDNTDGLRWM